MKAPVEVLEATAKWGVRASSAPTGKLSGLVPFSSAGQKIEGIFVEDGKPI